MSALKTAVRLSCNPLYLFSSTFTRRQKVETALVWGTLGYSMNQYYMRIALPAAFEALAETNDARAALRTYARKAVPAFLASAAVGVILLTFLNRNR